MKVNVNVNDKDNIFWALCEIIGEEREKGTELISNAEQFDNGYVLDFDLKINGIEFNFENIINRLVESQNKIIDKAVKERLKDKFADIYNKANEIMENLDYINVEVEERSN